MVGVVVEVIKVDVVVLATVVDVVVGFPVVLDVVDRLKLVVVCCVVTDTQRNNTTYCNLFIAYPRVQCIIYTVDTILLLYFF
jgi:hypothetical protein